VNQLLLVDGHAYAYRAFHAIRGLTAPDGRPTNAIFGFIKMLQRAMDRVEPTHVAVVWDGGLDEGRVESLPDYKAGILSVCEDGVEADDLIATMASQAARSGGSVVIATSDKDFMQLVSDRVRLLNPGDKTQALWTEREVIGKTGVQPGQIVDWLSLVGDAVDNIRGVAGVGAKTAAKLLREFGSVDGLYAGLDSVAPARLQPALLAARDVVLRNRELVRLKTDLRSAPDPGACAPGGGDRGELVRLLQSWGFKSMAEAHRPGPAEQELPL